jgi:hypothetical protein
VRYALHVILASARELAKKDISATNLTQMPTSSQIFLEVLKLLALHDDEVKDGKWFFSKSTCDTLDQLTAR